MRKLITFVVGISLILVAFTACGEDVSIKDDGDLPDTDIINEEEEKMSIIDYDDSQWYDDALLINNDPNWYGGISSESAEAAIESAKAQALRFVGHNITDIMYGVFEQTSIIPSEVQMWRASKYNMTEENGIPVDYSFFEGFYNVYTEYNVDPLKIIFDTFRENSIRPWISFRMNDCHFGADETSFLKSDFFYEANWF